LKVPVDGSDDPTATGMSRYAPLIEGLGLLAVTLPLALVLHIPTLWFLAPVLLLALTKRAHEPYGLTLSNPGTWRFHVIVAGGFFVPYLLAHFVWGTFWQGREFDFRLPAGLEVAAINQVLAIGLPEEMFFRGYLQTQFDKVWRKPWTVLGARCGWGLVLAAALFAVCHVFNGGPARLIVFFPGLWYGWLRSRTDTIAVPALYHAASNLLMQIMLTSFSPR